MGKRHSKVGHQAAMTKVSPAKWHLGGHNQLIG